MTKRIRLNVNLPFPGFYGSWIADLLDREESDWIEYEETEREDGELAHPPELRLNGGELADLLMRHTTYREAHEALARYWVGDFSRWASRELGIDLGLTFEALISPRFYNFETDRVFADVDLKVMRELLRRSAADDHEALRKVIEDRFTSYDGFSSFYVTDLDAWLRKPLRDWDHNELGTLLVASLQIAGADYREFERDVEENWSSNGTTHGAWESAVDWDAFKAARDDLRALAHTAAKAEV